MVANANVTHDDDVKQVTNMILLTGDTHGDMSIRKLNNPAVRALCDGNYPSHVIILGDFGIIWSNDPNNTNERYWLKWLDEKPWITLVTLGNHENYERIYNLPLVDLYGGKAYQASEKVFILQHGHIFNIEGKTFFNFGGAVSIDKVRRRNRLEWWEEENPTQSDFMRGDEALKAVDYQVDYVITHTAPQEAIDHFQHQLPFGNLTKEDDMYYDLKKKDPAVQMFTAYVKNGLKFKRWYFGHFHINQIFDVNDRHYHVMWDTMTVIR